MYFAFLFGVALQRVVPFPLALATVLAGRLTLLEVKFAVASVVCLLGHVDAGGNAMMG